MSVNYTESEASEQEARYLVLRQLAKDVNVRLSDPLEGSQTQAAANLLAISNVRGLAFAATSNGFLVLQLASLRSFFKAAARNTSPRVSEPLRSIDTTSIAALASKVTFLKVANGDASLVAGFESGAIATWDVTGLVSGTQLNAAFILQPPSAGLKLLDLAPNPSDRPELCVALYSQPGEAHVYAGTAIVLDITRGTWGSELNAGSGGRTSCLCWSVKGKQIALGLENGEIAQITPEGDLKDRLSKPTSLEGDYFVSDVRWLENHAFIATYNRPAASNDEPEHSYEVYAILRDAKAKQITFAKFPMDPAPPYGDTSRKGNRYVAWLKGWEPAKHLVFVGSSPSTDVGLLGCSSSDHGAAAWSVLELEETSRPILPFSSVDKSSDTAPVGLELDLTSSDEVEDPNAVARGDDKTKLPAVPILYVYTSDGVLLAYDVINTEGGPFPGMVTPSEGADQPAAGRPAESAASPAPTSAPAPSTTPASTPSKPSAFGQTGASSAFGQAQTPSSSSTPAFGQPSAFGKSSPFGAAAAASPGGGASAFGTPSGGSGFGAFGSGGKPSAFGTTGFGFGNTSAASPTPSTPTGAEKPRSSASAFGSTATPMPSFGSPSAFGSPAPSTAASSAKPAFGQNSGFGSTSAFGQTSAFGSPGGSPFGSTPTTPAAKAESGSSGTGGFGSLPSSTGGGGGFGGFAAKSGSAFGTAPSASTSGSVFGSGGKLETGTTPAKPFGSFGGTSGASSFWTTPKGATQTVFGGPSNTSGFSAFAANKAAEEKEKGPAPEEKNDAAGSFSFGGLDDMLGASDGAGKEPGSAAAAKEPAGTASSTPDSGVDSLVATPSTQPPAFSFESASTGKSAGSPFSFGNASRTNVTSSPSSSSSSTVTDAARGASPPAPAPAFSSFQPGFGAGSSFGSQPFSFANNQNGQQKAASPFSFGNGVAKEEAKKPASAFATVNGQGQQKKEDGIASGSGKGHEGDSNFTGKEADLQKDAPATGPSEASQAGKKEMEDRPAEPALRQPESKSSPATKPVENADNAKDSPKLDEGKVGDPASEAASSPATEKEGDGPTTAAPSVAAKQLVESRDAEGEKPKSAFSFAPRPTASSDAADKATLAPSSEAEKPKSPFSFAPTPAAAGADQRKDNEQAPKPSAFSFAPQPGFGSSPSQPAKAAAFTFGNGKDRRESSVAPGEDAKKEAAPSKPTFGFGSSQSSTLPTFGSQSQSGAPLGSFSFAKPSEKSGPATPAHDARGSTTPPDSPQKPARSSPFSFGGTAVPQAGKLAEQATEDAIKVKEEPPSPPGRIKSADQKVISESGKGASPNAEGKEQQTTSSSPTPSMGGLGQPRGGIGFGKSAEPTKSASTGGSASLPAPSPPSSIPALDQAGNGGKPQSFFGFNSRAPRSSSPLAGAPVTSADLSSPSPEKAIQKPFATPVGETKPISFNLNKFAPKPATSSPLSQPSFGGFGSVAATQPKSAVAPKPASEGAAAAASTPKPSFSFGPGPSSTSQPEPISQPSSGPSAGAGAWLFGKSTAGPGSGSQTVATTQAKPSSPIATAPPPGGPARGTSPLVGGQAPLLGGNEAMLDPDEVTEKGIQGEFLKAYLILSKELGVLRNNVNQCAAFLAQLRQPTGLPQSTADFSDPARWSFGDLEKLIELAQSLETETGQLEVRSTGQKRQLTELQSMQLKAEAKREELARFIRARSDPEFAKIVRVRQLGPEHVENQNKLRKTSQLVRERMQELDEYLAVLKNRITNEKLGRRSTTMKAPTLDSVARATRNITTMASDRILELDHLALQLDMLKIRSSSAADRRQRDGRSISVSSRLSHSTPFETVGSLADSLPSAGSGSAAVTSANRTAAVALRAERTKAEAKDIFLAARSEPLLNRTAVPKEQTRRGPTKAFESSDLQIAFARGPVHLTQRPPSASPAPAGSPVAPVSQQASGGKPMRFAPPSPAKPLQTFAGSLQPPAPPPGQQLPTKLPAFGGFATALTPLNFGPPPSGAIFDLPVEDKPFMPGARPNDGGPNSRVHHSSKPKSRSTAAVSLPPAHLGGGSGSPGTAKRSDFFASPATAVAGGDVAPLAVKPPAFTGFGSSPGQGFGSLAAAPSSAPSFSFNKQPSTSLSLPSAATAPAGTGKLGGFSFEPPSRPEPMTFGGLQQPKPLFGRDGRKVETSASSGAAVAGATDESDAEEGDDDYDEEEGDEEGDFEDEYDDEEEDEDGQDEEEDDDDDDYEDEGDAGVDEEGLSAVEEEEEEEQGDEGGAHGTV